MKSYLGTYALLGSASFLLSLLLTRILISVAPRLGLVDEPERRKFHRHVTPLGGGLAMYLAVLPVLLVSSTYSQHTLLIVLLSGLVALVGLIDDLRGVSAPLKLLTLLAVTTALWSFGVGAHTTRVAAVDYLITLLWVAGVSSAFNAIDNMDGLATGVSAIAALSFVIIAFHTSQWVLGGLSVALLGSSLGFLFFNFHPARIFMGDTGSFFLGFLLASLGVVGDWNANEVIAAIIPILVLGLPIFDLAFTVLFRHATGITRTLSQAIHHSDTDHLSHRLVRLGLTVRGAVLFLYLIALSFGLSAVTLRNAASSDGVLHLLQALVITIALLPLFRLGDPKRMPEPKGSAEDTADRRAAGF